MNTGVIATRYARALLKSVTDAAALDTVYHEMLRLAQCYIDVPQVRKAIDNPMLPKAQKAALLATMVGGTVSSDTQAFLATVLDQGREELIQFMANAFVTLYRKEKNIISSRLVTAVPVDRATEQQVRQMIGTRIDGNVEFVAEVDPTIIGGFILEYDTYRMDASVQTQLRKILNELK